MSRTDCGPDSSFGGGDESPSSSLALPDPYLKPLLPTCGHSRHFGSTHISGETMVGLIDGKFADKISEYVIIDCRYDYEFEGGHIKGALNLNTEDQIKKLYHRARKILQTRERGQESKRRAIIFHCEFSVNRGPFLCSEFRKLDRASNTWPMLDFQEVHVLSGGYKEFFKNHIDYCIPKAYVPMKDAKFVDLLREREKKPSGKKSPRKQRRVVTPKKKKPLVFSKMVIDSPGGSPSGWKFEFS
jgi:M-phase inducer phosphatase 2